VVTRNWLVKRGSKNLPAGFGAIDKFALIACAGGLLAWIVEIEARITGALLILAGVAAAIRLARWRGYLATSEPLLWILHLGHGWLAIGLALLGASHLWPAMPATTALHALTAGAVGTMVLAVMTRASLGHTGRPLTTTYGTTLIYLLVTLAALLRVVATLTSELYAPLLAISGVAWIGAFALFVVFYARLLLTRHQRISDCTRPQ
jgi:uncharacterized protein involved in response to NO